jgi:predicted RNase H-like HicB family nuclease
VDNRALLPVFPWVPASVLIVACCWTGYTVSGKPEGCEDMKQYRLPVMISRPSAETENKYMAEVASLPGCRAWGDTPEEALDNVRSVASEFIQSYEAHGQQGPEGVCRGNGRTLT